MEGAAIGYRLDRLGWLQFEQLAARVLAADEGLVELPWRGRAYRDRIALVERAATLPHSGLRIQGPFVVAVAWASDRLTPPGRQAALISQVGRVAAALELGSRDRLLVVTNLEREAAEDALTGSLYPLRHFVVLGAAELGASIDRHASLRLAMPSLLGLRDLAPLVPADCRERSSLDVERAQELARVFVPTRAYQRAREVLERHRFVVLNGPPEMGKTAIARMLALAKLTAGWEAHDCISPAQVWNAFDRDRPQVFVADDAFGSTEYRPDSAEEWARELGRMLAVLDERHWLIWTSRPAPLKAGLRRLQRERGAERFPAPGEVLVDASELDLAEKTLILFRHVKNRRAEPAARGVVRDLGAEIVEHEHFTPERIRRFVTVALDELVATMPQTTPPTRLRAAVLAAVERELATPTEQMTMSFTALEAHHRALLVALLDAPAGLIDDRSLAATLRRHHPGGLSRPPHELIDRLSDHFLRVSSLGIDWVHPSWRDLVIEQLRTDRDARQRFLSACGPHGARLVLSSAGGAEGERVLGLLIDDADWDVFNDRVGGLLRELDDANLARLLRACAEPLAANLEDRQRAELQSLVEYVLGAATRFWDAQGRALPTFLLDAWYGTSAALARPVPSPQIAASWAALHPASVEGADEVHELRRSEEWLELAQTLARHDPPALEALGFPQADLVWLRRLGRRAVQLTYSRDRDRSALATQTLERLADLLPRSAIWEKLGRALRSPVEDRWWAPHDIDEIPTTERASGALPTFTREDIDDVLADL